MCREVDAQKFVRMACVVRGWHSSGGAAVLLSTLAQSEHHRRILYDDACEQVLGRRPKKTEPAATSVGSGSASTLSTTAAAKARVHDEPSPASKQPTKRGCLQSRQSSRQLSYAATSLSGFQLEPTSISSEDIAISGEKITISDEPFYLQIYNDRCDFSPPRSAETLLL